MEQLSAEFTGLYFGENNSCFPAINPKHKIGSPPPNSQHLSEKFLKDGLNNDVFEDESKCNRLELIKDQHRSESFSLPRVETGNTSIGGRSPNPQQRQNYNKMTKHVKKDSNDIVIIQLWSDETNKQGSGGKFMQRGSVSSRISSPMQQRKQGTKIVTKASSYPSPLIPRRPLNQQLKMG